jgi:hypothetical protein
LGVEVGVLGARVAVAGMAVDVASAVKVGSTVGSDVGSLVGDGAGDGDGVMPRALTNMQAASARVSASSGRNFSACMSVLQLVIPFNSAAWIQAACGEYLLTSLKADALTRGGV